MNTLFLKVNSSTQTTTVEVVVSYLELDYFFLTEACNNIFLITGIHKCNTALYILDRIC
jgi:hypothetical protein